MSITCSVSIAVSRVTESEGITAGEVPLMHSVTCASEDEANEFYEILKKILDSCKKMGDT